MSGSVFYSGLLIEPNSMCFDENNNLYVNYNISSNQMDPNGNIGSGKIIKIDQSGNGVVFVDLGDWYSISGITYHNNYLYISAFSYNGEIYKVNITDASSSLFYTITDGSTVSTSSIIYYSGHIYVIATGFEVYGVYKINIANSTGVLVMSLRPYNNMTDGTFIGIGTGDLMHMAIDGNGNLYIVQTDSVIKFNNNGDVLSYNFINGFFNNISYHQNNFYIINYNNNSINQYGINGTLIKTNFANINYYYFSSIAFDSNNKMYYLSYNSIPEIRILTSTSTMACFYEDTKILTDIGYRPIKELQKGDLIKTLKHEYIPINMIGMRQIYNVASNERIKDQLYKCSNDNYPEVFEDLLITGCHSILVDNFTNEEQKNMTIEINKKIFVTDGKYRLPASADLRASIYDKSGICNIYHLALENDDYYMNYGIYANGLLVETCSKRYLKELSNMILL
jgi:hypothetical protein